MGTDIIEIRRMAHKLVRTGGLKERLFTKRESAYCESKGRSAQHFAARFAAKEAFLKAMGTGWRDGYRFDEIEIVNDEIGKPEVVVYGKIKDFCHKNRITRIHVSLSHSKDIAQAVVFLETSQLT
jgi:holo-[acyl-carrier protein] synthase